MPAPDSGDVRTDVAQLLTTFADTLSNTPFPRLLAAYMDAAERDPVLQTLHADLTARRREPLLTVLRRARDRGELDRDLDLDLTVDLLAAPLFDRRFVAHRPITAALIDDIIASVLR